MKSPSDKKIIMEHEPEFNVGDRVTFAPYEKNLAARVRTVLPNHFGDGRVVYHLTSSGRNPVLTFCAGESILESKFYTKN